MADHSGRTDLAVGDVAEAGAKLVDYLVGTVAVVKGDVVKFESDLAVVPATATTDKVAGVAVMSGGIGTMISVIVKGVVKVAAAAAIAIGMAVEAGAASTVAAIATPITAALLMSYLGYTITANTTGAGDLTLVRVCK